MNRVGILAALAVSVVGLLTAGVSDGGRRSSRWRTQRSHHGQWKVFKGENLRTPEGAGLVAVGGQSLMVKFCSAFNIGTRVIRLRRGWWSFVNLHGCEAAGSSFTCCAWGYTVVRTRIILTPVGTMLRRRFVWL